MILFIIFSFLLYANCDNQIDFKKKMEKDGVVPDTIDEAPNAALTVIYGPKQVNFGEELTPTEVKDEPEIKWQADPKKYYLLAMIDPDAPSRENPTYREVNHWLVGNILGNNIKSGEILAAYRGSGPPKGTGLHRYIFLVYEQKEKLTFDEPKIGPTDREPRLKFSIRKFAEKYDLGKPLFGNFYKAQWDAYVDERNKQKA